MTSTIRVVLGSGPFSRPPQMVFDSIAANPLIHGVVLADIRKAVLRRFPHCIYYRAHPDRVEVIAVFHTSRDPKIWRGRV